MKKKVFWSALIVGAAVIVAEMALSHAKVLKQLEREQTGSAGYEEELLLSAGQLLEDYPYSINVEPQKLTEKEAKDFLKQAEAEIDATFYMEGETADHVTLDVQPQKSYQNGMVQAEWYFDNYEVINEDGVLNEEQLNEDAVDKKEGVLLCAVVMLSCEEYEEEYQFYFRVYPRPLGEKRGTLKADCLRNQGRTGKQGENISGIATGVQRGNIDMEETKTIYWDKNSHFCHSGWWAADGA